MKPETLESLLLDRALGELSPPVAALLDEHLARDHAAARQAEVLAATLQLARRADPGPVQSVSGSLPDGPWLRRAAWQVRWRNNLLRLGQLAACLLLGVFLGRAIRPHEASAAPGRPPLIVAAPVAGVAAASTTKFWSMTRRVAEQTSTSRRSGSPGRDDPLRWESPFKMPRVEEKP
jgi:hypothetical protein